MTRNPILNALAALAYISIVACVMFYAPQAIGPDNTVFGPIAIISLFTLSASIISFIFLYKPAQLYLENDKKDAVGLFLKTVAIFAVLTVGMFVALILIK